MAGPARATISIDDLRASEASRKKASRQKAAALYIPVCKNKSRRTRLEKDPPRWLRYYLADVFVEPFCEHHLEMINAIVRASNYSGNQAVAGPRGEWKTSIAEGTSLNRILCGVVPFLLLLANTGPNAEKILESIKDYIVNSEAIQADYPEVWHPVDRAKSKPQLAHSMVAYGDSWPLQEISFQWSGQEVTFPNVPGSRCAKAIIATRGLDGSLYGMKRGTQRPSLVVIDDPDTDDTIRSLDQTAKLVSKIDRTVAAMGTAKKRASIVFLSTVHNDTCASAIYTDPKRKPSFVGKRFKFILALPSRMDLWEEYVTLRRECQRQGDPEARLAHAFYLERRVLMDDSAAVARDTAFDSTVLPDKTRKQVSALQAFFDFWSDYGKSAAMSEYQGETIDDNPNDVKLNAVMLAERCNGLARGVVPKNAQWLTAFVDVHLNSLYWIVCAWHQDFSGSVIDYGVFPEQPIPYFSQASIPYPLEAIYGKISPEAIVHAALNGFVPGLACKVYQREDGSPVQIAGLLIDTGWNSDVVCEFCRRSGMPQVAPSRGIGIGATKRPMSEWARDGATLRGLHWMYGPTKSGNRVMSIDTNFWKTTAAGRLLMPMRTPGAWDLFGNDPERHRLLCDHFSNQHSKKVCSEGRTVFEWSDKPGTSEVHWWDGLIGCAVEASRRGALIPGAAPIRSRRSPSERPTAAQLAATGRR
jgi:hypothetical protein